MNHCKLLFITALANLSLLACAANPTDLGPSDNDDKGDTSLHPHDLVRFEIEMVGEGQAVMVEPYEETCTTADGICTFLFEVGTRVVIESRTIVEPDGKPIADCSGEPICAFELDADRTVVAKFESTSARIIGERPSDLVPEEPVIISDPVREDGDLRPAASDVDGEVRETVEREDF